MTADRSVILLFGIALACVSTPESRADEPRTDKQSPNVKERVEQAIHSYDVLPHADAKIRLQPEIVMRWHNPVRVNTGAALIALWTDGGRPVAMASIFEWNGEICHEFGSLSRSSTVVARDATGIVWSPRRPGVEFADFSDAPAPAASPAARLRQMRSLAERFTARLPDRNTGRDREVLRLLSRPLYRYNLKDATPATPRATDGAMFAFAMGTDPEVVLLLEAVERGENSVWQYAFARATGWAAIASLGDKVVWSVDPLPDSRDPLSTQIQVRNPVR